MSVGLGMRRLGAAERAKAFAKPPGHVDLGPYKALLREMEGDMAYGVSTSGMSVRQLKWRLTRSAKELGLSVRYARGPVTATELIVELAA